LALLAVEAPARESLSLDIGYSDLMGLRHDGPFSVELG
jgi:hypothetical protein